LLGLEWFCSSSNPSIYISKGVKSIHKTMNNGKTNKNKSKINKKEAVTSTNGSRRGTKAGMLRPVLNLLNAESMEFVKYSKMGIEVQSRNTPNWVI
jgi:hypothetical protein